MLFLQNFRTGPDRICGVNNTSIQSDLAKKKVTLKLNKQKRENGYFLARHVDILISLFPLFTIALTGRYLWGKKPMTSSLSSNPVVAEERPAETSTDLTETTTEAPEKKVRKGYTISKSRDRVGLKESTISFLKLFNCNIAKKLLSFFLVCDLIIHFVADTTYCCLASFLRFDRDWKKMKILLVQRQ